MEEDDTQRGDKRRLKPYSPHYRADNSGGFGNPPVGKQFAMGNSGGPGRPKGRNNIESQLRKVLRKKLTVNKEGQSKQMQATEVFAERLLEAILTRTSSPAMLQYGLEILSRFGPQAEQIETVSVTKQKLNLTVLSDDELDIYGEMCATALGQPMPVENATTLGRPGNSLYRLVRGTDRLIRFERVTDTD